MASDPLAAFNPSMLLGDSSIKRHREAHSPWVEARQKQLSRLL